MSLDLRRKLARLAPPPAIASAPEATSDVTAVALVAPEPAPIELASVDPAETERKERIAKLRATIAQLEGKSRSALRDTAALRDLARAETRNRGLPGEVVETPHGPLHRVATYLEPAHAHGRVPIASALDVEPAHVATFSLDPSLGELDLSRMLLIDTETTGLSGGTGTLPFLLGMAWFEDRSLRLEQLLLRRPGEEGPMLRRLAERLAEASCIVTYNGKSFDWPLLRTRAVMNRVPLPPPRAHVDLLHASRRIFGRRLADVRLVSMESEVLGKRRERDIDGAEIPELFFRFVRGESGAILAPVIEHNAHDLIALAAILAVLAERVASARAHHAPEDRLAVASLAMRSGDAQRALSWACDAADAGGDDSLIVEALLLAARAARKARDRDREGPLLERALAHAHALRREETLVAAVRLALAKHLEHHARDLPRALEHARHTAPCEGDERCTRRVERLTRRAQRTS